MSTRPPVDTQSLLNELVSHLALERIEANLFRGQSQDLGWGTVFGGQVLGQALSAASQTVPAPRAVHSMHAYFLRPGDVAAPILYDVDRIRDGSSFTTRRVVAIQHGQPIFNMAASFQLPEEGFEHQDAMPDAPDPLTLPTETEWLSQMSARLPSFMRKQTATAGPMEFRLHDPIDDPIAPSPAPPARCYWMRAAGALPDDPAIHRYLLAYASDWGFLTTALQPHGVTWLSPGLQVASIDHVMWFHQPFRCDEWLLCAIDSPSASGARGLVRARIFRQDGTLVASTAQEGLIRRRARPPAG